MAFFLSNGLGGSAGPSGPGSAEVVVLMHARAQLWEGLLSWAEYQGWRVVRLEEFSAEDPLLRQASALLVADPIGLSRCVEVVRHVRVLHEKLPVVVLSSADCANLMAELMTAGATMFVRWPAPLQLVLRAVQSVLARQNSS
jgi:DNA-binding NarL/FixJ family response regulator